MGTFTVTQTPNAVDVYIYPESDTCIELDRSGDNPNYACVDEDRLAPDDDDTYVYNDTAVDLFDIYGLPNQSLSGTINYIQVYARTKSHITSQHADGIYKILVSPDGSCTDIYASNDINVVTSYTTYLNTWTENPQTSLPWTWDDVDAMGIGSKCNSPTILSAEQSLTRRPISNFFVELTPVGAAENWDCVNEAVPDDNATYVHIPYDPPDFNDYDVYNITSPGFTTEVPTSVSVNARVRTESPFPNDSGEYYVIFYTHGNAYPYSQGQFKNADGWVNISEELPNNPWSGSPWSVAEINALKIGIKIYVRITSGPTSYFKCTQVYTIIKYSAATNPEIRTTQSYAKVNYVPGDVICTLQKPDKISTDHARNIKMLNFWSGNRVVYDLNRSGKSTVLTGTEYDKDGPDDVCTRIQCMRQQGENGADVVVSGLGGSLWDGTYKIRSFGWKHISECPDVYDWILELEDTRYCSECGDGTYD